MARSNSPRRLAWELLREVWEQGAYANLAWPALLGQSTLEGSDRGFATELAYGSLRHWGQWGRVIEQAGGRSEESLDQEVWWVLVLGVHQLLALGTPAHAAVNESVELAKHVGKKSATGLVNAVLRKVAARSHSEWMDVLTSGVGGEVAQEALRGAHPEWVARLLHAALEREGRGPELPSLLQAHNTPAPVTLAILQGMPREPRTPYSPLGEYLDSVPADEPRVKTGAARVQDEGSQLAALVATGLGLPKDAAVVDACAGPGGKTAVLGTHFSHITALEQHEHRAALVRHAVKNQDHPALVQTGDAIQYFQNHEAKADLVVLDAPCLGLGALRRRPEARWTKKEEDLVDLVQTQRKLLTAAVSGLRPGGYCVYITCSPVVAETTEQIAWICEHTPGLRAVPTAPILDAVSRVPVPNSSVGTAVQLWPDRHGTDAMFIQVLAVQT